MKQAHGIINYEDIKNLYEVVNKKGEPMKKFLLALVAFGMIGSLSIEASGHKKEAAVAKESKKEGKCGCLSGLFGESRKCGSKQKTRKCSSCKPKKAKKSCVKRSCSTCKRKGSARKNSAVKNKQTRKEAKKASVA